VWEREERWRARERNSERKRARKAERGRRQGKACGWKVLHSRKQWDDKRGKGKINGFGVTVLGGREGGMKRQRAAGGSAA
jgi:hypothetical protein